MANKKTKEAIIAAQKLEKFKNANKKLNLYTYLGIGLIAVIVLTFFVKWAGIYNTDIKDYEVSFSGFNALFAAFSGNYSSADKTYGDIAVPFYYYAAKYCKTLGALTIVSAITLLPALASQILTLAIKKQFLNVVSAALLVIEAIVLIATFATALSMSGSDILPIYCSGNPACSIKSYAIVPAIAALGAAVPHVIASVFYFRSRNILK